MEDTTLVENLKTELRRGTQILAVLNQLKSEQYGYSLLQSLVDQGISIESGTLYPLLRRLESQGLLNSEWDTSETRPRKYYTLSETGKAVYKQLKKEWKIIVREISSLLEGENNDE